MKFYNSSIILNLSQENVGEVYPVAFSVIEVVVGAIGILASARTGVLGWTTVIAVGLVFAGFGGVAAGTIHTGMSALALALMAFGLGMNVGPRRHSFRWHKGISG